ncbi:hypothetical protein J5Y09_07205 [Roseomonas sp. PWR1]|uniref:Glycosyltransferase RgtA/B/C/D-like domain-containing protein n=1 Tax=Roseomonas nitratireducens TaxID=2820810 RepID=A0ABS4AS44_9PROT|nr:hypothetical protein [Neoroseomonas nitratireducens]MBP0463693.1 hypothetical protein [Neoroseomonas nitratireducens]
MDRPAVLRPGHGMVWRAVALAPCLFFLVTILLPPINHDVAAVLDFARRWLAGERLYVDLVDVNPPLIFVLNLLPAALARYTPLAQAQAVMLCLLGLAALLWRMAETLRRGRAEGPVESAVLTATVPLLLVMAGSDFGQREVLMAMVAIPYCLLAARRVDGPAPPPRLATGVALVAALGFALKPHFLLIPLLIEALALLRRGAAAQRRDPVPWTMAAVWAGYLASVPVFFPAYLAHVVPMAWGFYGEIHGAGRWRVLVADVMGSAEALLLLALPIALRPGAGTLAQTLGLATVGAFASAWLQHKGWTYHVLPITILGCAALLAAGAHWADRALPGARASSAAPALAAIAALGVLVYVVRGGETPWRQLAFHGEAPGQLAEWLGEHARGQPVLVLSPDVFPIYPALTYADAHQILPVMSIWPLQGFYRLCPSGPVPYREAHEMGAVEFDLFQRVAEAFAAAPPPVLVAARHANIPACGGRFDVLAYFARHPLFAEALEGYRLAGEIEGHRLFRRQD